VRSQQPHSPGHGDRLADSRALVRDRGSQFVDAFDEVFRTIIWNRHQLERLVTDYINHYNARRPHRSLDQRPPPRTEVPPSVDQRRLASYNTRHSR
jgi:transposase InsO family protein